MFLCYNLPFFQLGVTKHHDPKAREAYSGRPHGRSSPPRGDFDGSYVLGTNFWRFMKATRIRLCEADKCIVEKVSDFIAIHHISPEVRGAQLFQCLCVVGKVSSVLQQQH